MDKYTNEYGRTNDPETFARFASVKSYQDYLVDKNNPVVMVTLMIDGKDFLGNAHFKTYLTQRTNDHDEFTIVVRENAIDPIKRPVMEKSGDLLGESIVIKFHQYGKVVQTYKGVITKIENYKEEGGGYGELRISGKSPSILLENGKDCQTYIEKDLPEIIKEATEEYPNFAKVYIEGGLNNSSRIPYCVQYNESDFSFISRLAKRYGEFFYYNGLQLIFGNKAQETILLTHGAELIDVSFEVELQPQNFRYVGYDTHYNNTDQKEAKDIITQDKINPVIWDAIKGANKIYTKVPEKLASNIPTEYTSGYLNRAVELEKEKREQMMVVKGKSRNPQMRVGVFAKLRSIYDLPMETFRVIEIKHYQEGYEYYNEFTAIPDAFIPYYYDEDSYPKALQQPARVIDNNDPEGLGRVQVQFVWQERKKEHTPWIRVVQPHAGAGKGFYFIPEIGEEVLVDFEFQNAERPYVVGAHYNGEEMSHYHTKGNDKKVIHTRSGTKIVLNDGEGSVFIEDPSGNSIYMDGKQKISFNGATLEFNAQRIVMNATESTHITTNDYILNALSKIYVFSAWFKQQITGFMQLLSNSALIKSPNTIDIEAKEAKLQGTEKSIVDSKKQAIVNSLGTAELKGKEGNRYTQNADNVSSSPDEEIGLAVVHFRPLDSWRGEFGFDWLRINDGASFTKEKPYEEIIEGGYTDKKTDDGRDRDLSKTEAYQNLKNEYEKYPIKRREDSVLSDHTEYYVPYLTMFSRKFVQEDLKKLQMNLLVKPKFRVILNLLIEVEEDLDKLKFVYNDDYIHINRKEIKNIKKTSLTDKFGKITILCKKDLVDDTPIKVYAYPKANPSEENRKLAGEIILLRNNEEVRKKKNIVLVSAITAIDNNMNLQTGFFSENEKYNLYYSLYQSLIIPYIEESSLDLAFSNTPNINHFKRNQKYITTDGLLKLFIEDSTGKRIVNSDLYLEVKSIFLGKTDSNGTKINAKYNNFFTVFNFGMEAEGVSIMLGAVQDIDVPNVIMVTTTNDDDTTLNHEVLHGLGLCHTHRDAIPLKGTKSDSGKEIGSRYKYIYPCAIPNSFQTTFNPDEATTNIMSYNRKSFSSWRWQWIFINPDIIKRK
ncbi:phage baseplate assembly protein V [Capnocytophaga sputigena]|uniref:type VI secretion system Vgr family protein n=1 Tax=Capnocytophaga sputigena TaxID=1019 RepID=UPI00288B52C1|nr:phage baseplate assembly protein V [Capnocytophaga sputigena]